jgi:hypothetical protein
MPAIVIALAAGNAYDANAFAGNMTAPAKIIHHVKQLDLIFNNYTADFENPKPPYLFKVNNDIRIQRLSVKINDD